MNFIIATSQKKTNISINLTHLAINQASNVSEQ